MIRLDKQTNQKEQILELIGYTLDNPELELECLINNSPNKSNPNITHANFISIIKRFKGNLDYNDKSTVKLNISFPNSSKYKDVRVTVKNPGAVKSYCNNENINVIRNSVDFEVKEFANTRIKRVNIPNYNMRFNLKQERNFNNDETRIKEILRDWATENKQYRYKKTFSFVKKTGDYSIDLSIVKSSIQEDKYLTVKEVKQLELYNNVVKPDDVKTQFMVWWKSIEDKPDQRVLVRNFDNSYKNIKDSNVFTNIPKYEVEIEYIKNKTTDKPRFKNITDKKNYIISEFGNYFRQIGIVLQCVGGSCFILSNDEKYQVKKDMIKVIESSITESILERPKKIQRDQLQRGGGADLSDDEYAMANTATTNATNETNATTVDSTIDSTADSDLKGSANVTSNEETEEQADNIAANKSYYQSDDEKGSDDDEQKGGAKSDDSKRKETIKRGNIANKITEIRKTIRENMNRGGVFFGPNIVDLNYQAISKLDPTALPDVTYNTNIQINYTVTDKTDGERNLMFIDSHGKAYGIERSNNIKYLGVKLPQLANSVYDGEFVNRNEAGRLINHYYIFDCYIYRGENVMNKPFNCNRQTGRHAHISSLAKYFSTGTDIIQDNDKIPLLIFKKEYLLGNNAKSFSILDADEKPLIFEQCSKLLNKMNKAHGGFLDVGHLFTYKTDGLVFLPDNLGVFQKSEDHYIENTFKQESWDLNYKWKPADHLTIDFKVQFQKDIDNKGIKYGYFNAKKYVIVNLISKVYQTSKFKDQLNYWLLNCGIDLKNIPADFIFFAQNPFIGSFDNEGNMQNNMGVAYLVADDNDNIICSNGDIIVDGIICEFSYDSSIREEQFRWTPQRIRPDKTNPNAYFGTALTAWELINKPITKEFLSGQQYEEVKEGEPANLRDVIYYTSATQHEADQTLTRPLTKFNNFVKSYIIKRALSGYIKPKVLDLACGRFGDLFKYVECGVDTFVGIDINSDNIYNYIDGAATRMMKKRGIMPEINKLADKTILLVGDAMKNINSGECVIDNLNRYFLDVIYGRAKGRTPKLKKLEACALDHFDMVSCMYAIHYMLNDQESLDSFFRNVSENLLDQGYFIGTCLDGGAVLREMKGQDELLGKINNKVIFSLRKDQNTDYKNITLGNKITAFFETFSGQFEENLVNMNYIKDCALDHNLKLIEYKSFLEEPISLLTQFEKNKKHDANMIRNTESLMSWARMNYYFIFQKVRDIND